MAEDTRQPSTSGSGSNTDEPIVAFKGYKPPEEQRDALYSPRSTGSSSSTSNFRKLREDLGYANPQSASERTVDEVVIKRPASANALPGGTAHTAGGEKFEDKNMLVDAVKTVKWQDFMTVHQQPCARDGFVTGIAGGGATGALMWVIGSMSNHFLTIFITMLTQCLEPVARATNWAVLGFVFMSFGAYEICNYKRKVEKTGVRMMHEVMEEKRQKQKEQKELAKAEAERRKREREEEWKRRPWWRKWDRGQREG